MIRIIQSRLNVYNPVNEQEEQNAIKEITQEIALTGLSRVGFFKEAAFLGGTSLRILHGLNRFSEDLDFSLIAPTQTFNWAKYLGGLQLEVEAYGYKIEIIDRSSVGNAVKSAFLKENSIGKLLTLHHPAQGPQKTLKIKFEIDTNPPLGAAFEERYVDFPVTVPVLTYDLPSLFAGKSHALLCRDWGKGRDWFDFIWYVGQKTHINWLFLSNAIKQNGPWQGANIRVTKQWYVERLREKIVGTDWKKQVEDVSRFVKKHDVDLLQHWGVDFFLMRVEALEKYLSFTP